MMGMANSERDHRHGMDVKAELRGLNTRVKELTMILNTHLGIPPTIETTSAAPSPGDANNSSTNSSPKKPSESHSPPGSVTSPEISKTIRFIAKHQKQEIFGGRELSLLALQNGRNSTRDSFRSPGDDGTPKPKYRFMIKPASNFRFLWDTSSAVIILFIAATLPFRIAFVEDWSLGWYVIDFLIDLYFFADIALNFSTGYYDSTGKLVLDRKLAAKQYLKTWFPLDFIATLPLSWFINGLSFEAPLDDENSDEAAAQLFSMLRLFKLLKLLRLLRVAKRTHTQRASNSGPALPHSQLTEASHVRALSLGSLEHSPTAAEED